MELGFWDWLPGWILIFAMLIWLFFLPLRSLKSHAHLKSRTKVSKAFADEGPAKTVKKAATGGTHEEGG